MRADPAHEYVDDMERVSSHLSAERNCWLIEQNICNLIVPVSNNSVQESIPEMTKGDRTNLRLW